MARSKKNTPAVLAPTTPAPEAAAPAEERVLEIPGMGTILSFEGVEEPRMRFLSRVAETKGDVLRALIETVGGVTETAPIPRMLWIRAAKGDREAFVQAAWISRLAYPGNPKAEAALARLAHTYQRASA